ncbi:DUF4181 domain-containing protein [Pseudalkalibacillus sp. R45]|uniref:DUF4181 domain-containing protein n=1 Tax=Pseudalkalibacillus sp. R45 TaxID=3457433 RepID=UPI003FCEB031
MIWVKSILLLLIMTLLIVTFNAVMRRWLKVDKKTFSSLNPVNERHRKIDWVIRLGFIVILIFGAFTNVTRDPMDRIWFLETNILVFGLIIVSESVRAIMEKRYAENKNDYMYTILQLIFLSIITISVFTTIFFGWF